MKLIQSVAYKLSKSEDNNRSLKEENRELRQEVRALRLELARVTGQKPGQSVAWPSTSPLASRSRTCEKTPPSYAQSTKASRLRSSSSSPPNTANTSPDPDWSPTIGIPPSPTLLTVNGTDCTYQNGKLNVMQFGYLRTTASRNSYEIAQFSLRPHLGALNTRIRTASWGWYDSSEQTYNAHCSKKINHVENSKPANTVQIMSQTEWDDLVTQKAIAKRTRLADKAWTRGLIFEVYIHHDSLFDILSEAHTLGKRCLWRWTRTHRPDHCCGYRSDVDFGRDRLDRWVEHMPSESFKFRHSQSWQIHRKLNDLIRLRNFVCHFSGGRQDVCRMDEYLEDVQELAVLLYDLESAFHARALRDRLRGETERTLQEIETLTMLTALPEAGDPWLRHQSDTVRNAVYELDRGYYPHQHPILVTAAREWVSHQGDRDYGRSIPEAEGSTETEGKSPDGTSLLSAVGSEQQTDIIGRKEAVHRRRRDSLSADLGRSANVVGGQGLVGHRRRAASM